jgi:hypothetical protein
MTYGEFCKLFQLTHSPDTFRFWLLSHGLLPELEEACIEKARRELLEKNEATQNGEKQ